MARHPVLQNFYASNKWTTLRLNLINERGITCEMCKERVADTSKLIGHHKIELTLDNVHDYSISLNPEMVELICFDCHNKVHKRFGYNNKKEVYLVYGPPLSGKTTYVQQHMQRGDLIIDIDKLYAAITLLPTYDKPNSLYTNVNAVQRTLIDNIRTRYGKWTTAWVIGGYADKYKRERLAEDLGAETIYCECTMDECMQRLESLPADDNRSVFANDWREYISEWFEKFSV